MRKTIMETKRLKMVTTIDSDILFLYHKIFANDEVCRFTFGERLSLEESKAFMKKYFNYNDIFDFSPIIEKSTDKVIGYGGIFPFDYYSKDNQYEFGYAFERDVWGLGYATEIAMGQIEFIQKHFQNSKIMATTHPKNSASKRVLEKVGMELFEPSIIMGKRGLRDIYSL